MRTLAILLVALMIWGAGLMAFVARVQRSTPAVEPTMADGIVALTGSSDLRIEAATALLEAGKAHRMLVSGVGLGIFHHELLTPEKHDHVVLQIESGARVTFNDARRFGMMDLIESDRVGEHALLAALGPEPLGNDFNADVLVAAFVGKRAPVKAALLDQSIVAGLGNIYVCEALWRAGIDPRRLAGEVGSVDLLVRVIREVLSEAIEAGGSSLRDHRQTNGELGYFQHAFSVYGREGEACRTVGCSGIVGRIVQSGRSTFYCETCQIG